MTGLSLFIRVLILPTKKISATSDNIEYLVGAFTQKPPPILLPLIHTNVRRNFYVRAVAIFNFF